MITRKDIIKQLRNTIPELTNTTAFSDRRKLSQRVKFFNTGSKSRKIASAIEQVISEQQLLGCEVNIISGAAAGYHSLSTTSVTVNFLHTMYN